MHPRLGNEDKRLRVRFTNLDKVGIGTRVTFAGKPVGEVYSIEEIPEAIKERQLHNGSVYVYDVVLRVDSSVNVYNTDEIMTVTSGLLGERSIDIVPRAPKKGEPLLLVNDKIIYASNVETFEEIVRKTLTSILGLTTDIKNSSLLPKTEDAVTYVRDIAKALDDPDAWSSALDNLSTLFDRIVKSWDNVDKSLANATKITDKVITITDKGDKIVTKVSNGEGTVGKVLMREDLYLKVNALLNKGDIIMNDINHYGLLFHTDKNWQRLRARRLNLMQRLCSPQEFRNYFNDEVDQIATSLERVSMVLEYMEDDMCCCEMLDNREFAKVMAELLRRVNTLDEEIKSYNIQVFENCSVPKTEFVR